MSEMFVDGVQQDKPQETDSQTEPQPQAEEAAPQPAPASSGLVFEDPPAQVYRERKSAVFTDEVIADLKAAPGAWAILIPQAKQSQVGNAQAWANRRPGFRVLSRKVHKGSDLPFRVYAKFDPALIASDQKTLDAKAKKAAKS